MFALWTLLARLRATETQIPNGVCGVRLPVATNAPTCASTYNGGKRGHRASKLSARLKGNMYGRGYTPLGQLHTKEARHMRNYFLIVMVVATLIVAGIIGLAMETQEFVTTLNSALAGGK